MFNLGTSYWTYELQPDYLNPNETTPSWWLERTLNEGSLTLDPGFTALVQSSSPSPLITSNYFITPNPLISLYGIIVNYFNPMSLEGLPTEFMYATITNVGQQSIILYERDLLFNIHVFGLI